MKRWSCWQLGLFVCVVVAATTPGRPAPAQPPSAQPPSAHPIPPFGSDWRTNPARSELSQSPDESRQVGELPQRLPPLPLQYYGRSGEVADTGETLSWWINRVSQQVLDRERWVTFDLETLLLDTLAHSPKVLSVGYRTSATFQRVIEQDAAFDSTMLLSSNLGATNDPVGNTLTTGGAERLRERSLNVRGGARKVTRRGTELEWAQELGFLDSNSSFFVPTDQGNARLSLSLNKPLLSRGGRYYNERLVTQARIESRVAWQDMRGAVEQRIADVIAAYWRLYQARAQLTQQRELLARSQELERILASRKNFDTARIEIVKARQRVARRTDEMITLEAELKKQQARLAALVGSDALLGVESDLELIPIVPEVAPEGHWKLRDAVAQALQNRPEIRAATHELELAALQLKVTRVELQPQLNWIFNGYLAQLNGSSRVVRSFGEQFTYAPGVSTGLEFELPRGRRVFRAQHREALMRAKESSERLREVIQQTQFEVESALIELDQYATQLTTKRKVLGESIIEENILTTQWRIVGGDDSRVGIKLENLLDAQRKRTDAEKDYVAVQAAYMIALVQLQRSMGTLLIDEGIQPEQSACNGEVHFTAPYQSVTEAVPGQITPSDPRPGENEPKTEESPTVVEPADEWLIDVPSPSDLDSGEATSDAQSPNVSQRHLAPPGNARSTNRPTPPLGITRPQFPSATLQMPAYPSASNAPDASSSSFRTENDAP